MISEHTVIRHVSNMMSCFWAVNRMELLALAVVNGIVDSTRWPPRPTGKLSLKILGSLLALPDGAITRYDGCQRSAFHGCKNDG